MIMKQPGSYRDGLFSAATPMQQPGLNVFRDGMLGNFQSVKGGCGCGMGADAPPATTTEDNTKRNVLIGVGVVALLAIVFRKKLFK